MVDDGKNRNPKKRGLLEQVSSASAPLFTQRHYAVDEIAEMWNLSPDAVRKLFQSEAGVLTLGEHATRHKRRYTTLRIPESVVERVHRKFSVCLLP